MQSSDRVAHLAPCYKPDHAGLGGLVEPSDRSPRVYVFNPFAEAYIANGKAFTPVKHQAALAEDLANLPQFLCSPGDYILVPKLPSPAFLNRLKEAGFTIPQFVELADSRIPPGSHLGEVSSLQPWAWGPDSVELLEPLLARFTGEARDPRHYFNEQTAQLYSKAWSADFLRRILARTQEMNASAAQCDDPWLCSPNEAGVAVATMEQALEAIAAIRARGHHPVVVKQAHGLAGKSAIRLWEPDVLPVQRRWLTRALRCGRQVVVEPWLERVLDFSIQLEMGASGLVIRGYTGLINDRKGQFLANWAEPDYSQSLPSKVAASLSGYGDMSTRLQSFYKSTFASLEAELRSARFLGPISIDAFVYRTPQGQCRLKPVVEINPRYTMGRLTCELMHYTSPGSSGTFRLLNRGHVRAAGYKDFSEYGHSLRLLVDALPRPGIREGAICLNDPTQAQVCLAVFEAAPASTLPRSPGKYPPIPA